MDFGQLTQVNHVDFSLAQDDPRSLRLLPRFAQIGLAKLSIGAPIWTCPGWLGKIYPVGTPARDYLAQYSQRFTSIELNSTFYGIPEDQTILTWREKVTPGFRFCPKVPEAISHSPGLNPNPSHISLFCERMRGLGPHLGLSFIQLPPHFSRAQLPDLVKCLDQFPRDFRLAVEFRHASWFTRRALDDETMRALALRKVSTVITDVAGRRDVSHVSLTADQVLIRFVGNEGHPSDHSRIEAWVPRIQHWLTIGLREVYFFIHHKSSVYIPELANHLIKSLPQAPLFGLQTIPILAPPDLTPPQMSLW